MSLRYRLFLSAAVLSVAATAASAEEGMWTFDNFPIAQANRDLGTRIDQAWLDKVRLASSASAARPAGWSAARG
jgi:hypothetical protein